MGLRHGKCASELATRRLPVNGPNAASAAGAEPRLQPRIHVRARSRSRIRSARVVEKPGTAAISAGVAVFTPASEPNRSSSARRRLGPIPGRSEEHTSELQSRGHLVCRLLLEKKK